MSNYEKIWLVEGNTAIFFRSIAEVAKEYRSKTIPYIREDLVNLKAESVPISELDWFIEKWKKELEEAPTIDSSDHMAGINVGYRTTLKLCIKELQNLIDNGGENE